MSILSDTLRQRIIAAAATLFARHGFHRVSMGDLARETGIARATLYLRFSDKRTVFEALAASLVDQALIAASAAWRPEASLAENVAATLLAKDLGFFHLLKSTPHGAQLLEVDAELTATHIARLDADFYTLLTDRARAAEAAGADLSVFDGPSGFARFIATAGAGLKHETRTEIAYRAAVNCLARVVSRAAGEDIERSARDSGAT